MPAEPDLAEPAHEGEAGQGPNGAVVRRWGFRAAALFTGCWPCAGGSDQSITACPHGTAYFFEPRFRIGRRDGL